MERELEEILLIPERPATSQANIPTAPWVQVSTPTGYGAPYNTGFEIFASNRGQVGGYNQQG
jgi:hypothetical protein